MTDLLELKYMPIEDLLKQENLTLQKAVSKLLELNRQKSLDDYRIEEQRQDIADLLEVLNEFLLYGNGEPGSARRRTWSRAHTLVEKHKGEANE